MATVNVPPGGFSTAYSAAAAGDTLILQPGTHVTSGRQTIGKRLIIQASNWNASTTPGRYVTGTTGHLQSDLPVVWQGGWNFSAADTVVRGIAFDGRMSNGPGHIGVEANGVTFEDCRFTDGYRYIMVLIGSATPAKVGVTFRRCRFRGIGSRTGNDHPIYLKTCRDTIIEDCIFYENAGWAMHCYTDCDGMIVRRCVVDRSNGGVVFAGDSTNNVGDGYSTNNTIEDSIFTNARHIEFGGSVNATVSPRYLAEFEYPGTDGINYIRRSDFWNGTTPSGVLGTIESGAPIQVASTRINANPLYANPTAGDFTLSASSPAIGMGPVTIQPGGAPPPQAPNSVTNLAQVSSDQQVALTWTQSTTASVTNLIRRSTTGFPANETEGTSIYSGAAKTSHTDTGLVNGTTYYYSVFAVLSGNPVGSQYSIPASIAGIPDTPDPPPPPPSDDEPAPGEPKFGKVTVGTTWRGMSADYKRASRFLVPALKEIEKIVVRLRGTVGATGTQDVRAFAYNDATGALLGVTAAQSISNALTEQWVTFTPASPITCPSNGGLVRLGLHTGSTAAGLQVATDIVAGALPNSSDTYADGTESTWTTFTNDQYELSICAVIADVAASADISADSTWTWTSSGNVSEIGTPSNIPASDVVYRLDTEVITYQIPTPYQVSTGAKLEWDASNSKFIYSTED